MIAIDFDKIIEFLCFFSVYGLTPLLQLPSFSFQFRWCVRRTNVTVTNIQARTTNFSLSLSRFFLRLLSFLFCSSFFRLRRRMTMQHRAISIGHITFDTHTFLFMTLSLSLDFSLLLFSLFSSSLCVSFAHTDIVLISGKIFVRLLMLLVMT